MAFQAFLFVTHIKEHKYILAHFTLRSVIYVKLN